MHSFFQLRLMISGSAQVQILLAMVRMTKCSGWKKKLNLALVNHIKKTTHRIHHHNFYSRLKLEKKHVVWSSGCSVIVISENMKKRKWSCKPLELNDTIHVQRFLESEYIKEKLKICNCDFFVELSKTNNIKHIVASNFISKHHEDIQYIEIIQDIRNINLGKHRSIPLLYYSYLPLYPNLKWTCNCTIK